MYSRNIEETIPLIRIQAEEGNSRTSEGEDNDGSEINAGSSRVLSAATSREEDDDSSNNASSECKSPGQRRAIIASSSSSSHKSVLDTERPGSDTDKRGHKWRHVQAVMAYYQALRKIKRTKSNQRWMKLRTTVQLSSAIQKKPPLKREDSFLKRFSTRQIPETQETVEDTGSEGATGDHRSTNRQRRRKVRVPRTVVNPDENFYFYWLWVITACVLYNLWTLIVRQSFPELQIMFHYFWLACDGISDAVFALDLVVQLRTGYLEQGLMVYDSRKLAKHYLASRPFLLDIVSLTPLDLLQLKIGVNPIIRFPRFFKVYRAVSCYYIVESRTVYPNFWRVINLIHILLILAHWFGCFYFLLSEAEGFQGDWVYPHRPGDYATLTRKYLGSLYWSTLTLTTIGDLPTPETNADTHGGPKFLPRRGLKSRLLQFKSNRGYVFTIVSYLIGVFIFATIVGQVGNVITNRNANRLEFERLLDGAKTYMRHHKVPGGMKRRVLRWYDYSWSRGRIQGGGDINTALGLLPDKLKTELALHVNLSVLKKVTIFQECQPEFLHDLVLKMKAYIFTPGDSICRKGEVAREMFIIADGILEVISETGRVLTTMKAGDFFGEIGILNLDGLNKRTADVRSVGYSELFSLSREDVLAAMKDYPEAQDILQTLGRKRLQEVKSMSRQKVKGKGEISPDKGGDDKTSKRIVHKLRSDVKGIRNAIRSRSRVGRRSGESLELQALTAEKSAVDGKTLKRMARVESDDSQHINQDDTGETTSGSKNGEKCISPIGAGLPLLSRLKLLKEKQDREEKAAKQRNSTSLVVSPQPQPTPSTSSAHSEPEVIGAGLPLLQRLLLLKAKEEREKNQLTTLNNNQASSSDTISPSSIKSPLSPTIKTLSPIRKGSESSSPGKLHSPTAKNSRKNSSGSSDGTSRPKVSFRDKILQVQGDGTAVSQPLMKEVSEKPAAVVEPTPKTESNLISIPHSVVSKIKSPAKAVGSTFRDKLKMLQGGGSPKESAVGSPKDVTIEKIKIPIQEKTSVEIIPLQQTESKDEAKLKKPWSKLKKAAILGESKSQSVTSEDKKETDCAMHEVKEECETETAVNTCVPIVTAELVRIDNNNVDVGSDNVRQDKPKICLTGPLEPVQEKSLDLLTYSPKKNTVTKPSDSKTSGFSGGMLLPKAKKYRSIDDLSPEYGGLPFVKKLKILNERQKLAELEKVVKFRSSSLDNTSSSEDLLCDTLTRSHSEGSTMDKRKYKRKSIDSIGSHGSNETLERRTLKSILKKLSEDVTPAESPEKSSELKRLICRAPTLEGFAARHSKFSKSVTFHRHTLPSPPASFPIDAKGDVFQMPELQNVATLDISPVQTLNIEGVSEALIPNDQIVTPTIETSITTQEIPAPTLNVRSEHDLQSNLDPMYDFKSLRPEEIKVPSEKPKLTLISAVANQRKLLRDLFAISGSLEEQEYFGEVLLGIKQVIQGHLHDVQGKFQDRFNSLENEVRKRDEIINQLQKRIQELERLGLPGASPTEAQVAHTELPADSDPSDVDTIKTTLCKNGSSGSEDISGAEEGFMRGDSLDTVFATSPPTVSAEDEEKNVPEPPPSPRKVMPSDNISEETLAEMTEGIELGKLSYSELQSLAETISSRTDKSCSNKEQWTVSKSKRLDLNLDGKAGTYSRKRAAKLRQRKSWEDQSDQESMEMQDLKRPLSPHGTSEDRSLLSPEQSSLRTSKRGMRPFHFFGTHLDNTKSKIKKTLSVDTGMHHTGRKEKVDLGRQRHHRKFSLGSFFGYHRGAHASHKPAHNCNDVVLDMGSDYSWSDTTSTSSSSDSESLPRTPVFEEFVESCSRRRRASRSSHGSISPLKTMAGSGGDWEVMMLAEELDKREREKEREESARRHHYSSTLRELEEESDTPQREDSLDEYSNIDDSNSSSTTHLLSQSLSDPSQRSLETSFTERSSRPVRSRQQRGGSVGEPIRPDSPLRQSRGLILRAASLDRETAPVPSQTRRFGSLKSASTDSHKRL
ncbi:cyclic nucleotide-gated ion channel-like isoform X5 [Choristoneura fumiferana]|uniref:cyclic nucleotide-gated ion channel-like isoform X5 n=1 Tax=Choristoneura fumiferana TaxID=7141 RepID=UPI003D15C482